MSSTGGYRQTSPPPVKGSPTLSGGCSGSGAGGVESCGNLCRNISCGPRGRRVTWLYTGRPVRIVRWKGSWSGERNVIGGGCVRGRVLHVARGLESLIGRFRAYLLILRSGLGRLLRHLRLAAAAYGVLLISLLLAGLAWYYVRHTVEAQDQVRFDETIQATQAAVDRRTDAYLDALFGGRGVFLASKAVERQEWENYVEGIETKSRLEGLQALGFAKHISPDERAAFVSEARKEGMPEMKPDLDPGGERSAYFPLALVAPSDEANLSMLNQDALRAYGANSELERRPRPKPRLRRVPSSLRRRGACGECRLTKARPRRVRRRIFQAGRAARRRVRERLRPGHRLRGLRRCRRCVELPPLRRRRGAARRRGGVRSALLREEPLRGGWARVEPVLRHVARIQEWCREQPAGLRARQRHRSQRLALRHHLDARA